MSEGQHRLSEEMKKRGRPYEGNQTRQDSAQSMEGQHCGNNTVEAARTVENECLREQAGRQADRGRSPGADRGGSQSARGARATTLWRQPEPSKMSASGSRQAGRQAEAGARARAARARVTTLWKRPNPPRSRRPGKSCPARKRLRPRVARRQTATGGRPQPMKPSWLLVD